MNDDQFDALDNRAKTAANRVQAVAQRRRRPAFDADQPMTLLTLATAGESRAPRRTAWVAAAAVVALAAGVVTFTTTGADDVEDATVAAAPIEDPRPFVADDLPDRLKPVVFAQMEGGYEGPLPSAMPVFGKTVEDPLAGATVVDEKIFENLPLTSFDVDGLTFYREQEVASSPGHLVGAKEDGGFILVFGATEDDALALARTVSAVDGDVVVDVDQLPDGWRRLVTVDEPSDLVFGGGISGFPDYVAGYYAEDGDAWIENGDAWIQVSSAEGNEPGMWAGRLATTESRAVMVRGHRGYVGSFLVPNNVDGVVGPPLTMRTMAWVERPGEVITVSGIAVSEDELLAAAQSVRPVEEQEWADLVEQSQLGAFGGFFDEGGEELGRTTGTFDDGTKWSLVVTARPDEEDLPAGVSPDSGVYTTLRVALSSDDSGSQGSSSSSNDSIEGFRSVETTDVGGRYFSSGIIADGVARVELQTADGSVLGDAQMVEVAGLRAYVTELTEDPTVLVAYRADGSEVGRVTVEELADNVTVSMDGDGSFAEQGTPVDADGNPVTGPVQPSPTTVVSGD